MDNLTEDLILTLQLEDLSNILENQQGREEAQGEITADANAAVRLYFDELRTNAVILSDRRFGGTVGEAEDPDEQLEIQHTTAIPAFDDLRARLASNAVQGSDSEGLSTGNEISEGSVETESEASPRNEPTNEMEFTSEGSTESQSTTTYMASSVEGPLTLQEGTGEGSSIFGIARSFLGLFKKTQDIPDDEPSDDVFDIQIIIDCVACGDGIEERERFIASCGDYYCRGCISTLFNHATHDESLFPPRCCRREIDIASARPFLNDELAARYEMKAVEFRTLDRTYCHDTVCGSFIPPENIDGDKATCIRCNEATCRICKSAAHEEDCPDDPALVSFMEAATAAGYQRCQQCKRMIELAVGCYHIT